MGEPLAAQGVPGLVVAFAEPCAAQVKHVKQAVLVWLIAQTAGVVHGCAAHGGVVLRVFAGTAAAVADEAAARLVLDSPEAHHPWALLSPDV